MDIEITELSSKLGYYSNSLKEYEKMLPDIMKMDREKREECLSDLYKISREIDDIISPLVKKSMDERE